jgi:hypothetical protein
MLLALSAPPWRAGATAEITQLVDDLSRTSAEFERLWRDNEIAAHHEELKRPHHKECEERPGRNPDHGEAARGNEEEYGIG